MHSPQPKGEPVDVDDGRASDAGSDAGATPAGQSEVEAAYISGLPLIIMVGVLFLGQFVIGLDSIMVGLLVPTLINEFGSVADVGWYASIYMMTIGAMAPTLGKVYTVFPVKTVFLGVSVAMQLGSLLCATAKSSTAFIAGRAVTGFAASGLLCGTQIITASMVPLHLRPWCLGVVGSGEIVATMAGPVVSGFIIERLGWPWCFWINIPVMVALIAMVALFFKHAGQAAGSQDASWREKVALLDLPGGTVLVGATVCLLQALSAGGVRNSWTDARVLTPLILSAFLFGITVLHQYRKKDKATIPPRLFKNRAYVACLFYDMFFAGAQLNLFYYLPSWIQGIAGSTPDEAALEMMPALAASIVGGFTNAGLAAFLGTLPPGTMMGTTLVCVGSGLLFSLKPRTLKALWMSYEALFGFGCGICTQQATIGAQAVLSDADIPIGLSIIIIGKHIAAAVFIAVAQHLFVTRLAPLSELLPDFDVASGANIGHDYLRKTVPADKFDGALGLYNTALTTTFAFSLFLGCVAFVCLFFIPWTPLKKRPEQDGYEPANDFELDSVASETDAEPRGLGVDDVGGYTGRAGNKEFDVST
ncbi:hypothetical protein CH063_11863 [Colletotrichum higginsianum]|uniref:MFS transporter n=1 Tax=Colletotrichum higginsianum (strain IMI 349063) TaxID=759273 RepID=H1VN41_COLHI|nr:MFS transporter [Colletotrichum higginsianum IMI 349063]OBR08018.1 MFS transporter [Colletotrichum higginsianum IMI 349063]CCF41645.1 hypothetical protein CH063_11863 [Colletotrichum higginsianum]